MVMVRSLSTRVARFLRSGRLRSGALAAFLVMTLGVTAALAYEAWRSGQAQQASATRALREYARFAALTYRQRVQARMYTSIVGVIRSVADSRTGQPAGPLPDVGRLRESGEQAVACRCGPALPATFYFRVTYGAREVSVTGITPTSRELAMLAGLPDSISPAFVAATDWDFATIYDVSGSAPRMLVVALRRAAEKTPRAVYGFGVPIASFNDVVFRGSATGPSLLALTPAEHAPNDSLLGISVGDASGVRFRATPRAYDGRYAASIPLGGVAGVSTITVALNPGLAPRLLIGGMPTSRLPLLIALLALCAVLLTTTIVLAWRATELARARSEFVANVSHELRTPLAQVLLFGETLSFGRMTTRREVRRAADIIVGETRRLMHLVDNVLMFGRAERGAGQRATELVSLAPLVRDVVTAFAPLAAAADSTVRVARAEDCVAPADRAALRQLLLNLLDNAVKYGPRGQTVTVGLSRVGPPGAERARLWVEDEGPGIPEADRERVWQPFARLSRDIESGTAGSGIGLAVVHQIVGRHGGVARVESAPGGGACVVVELPGATAPLTIDASLIARRSVRDQRSL
jgi:signal transduction histidine kinase